jgi:hypothetical protein
MAQLTNAHPQHPIWELKRRISNTTIMLPNAPHVISQSSLCSIKWAVILLASDSARLIAG